MDTLISSAFEGRDPVTGAVILGCEVVFLVLAGGSMVGLLGCMIKELLEEFLAPPKKAAVPQTMAEQLEAKSMAFPAPVGCVAIPTSGREVFTSEVLDPGRVYAVTMVGRFSCGRTYNGRTEWSQADPLYRADYAGNLTLAHDYFRLDGQPLCYVVHDQVQHDRSASTYTVHVDGTGQKLAMAVQSQYQSDFNNACGVVYAKVELLPEGTPSPRGERAAAKRRRQEETDEAEFARLVTAVLLLARRFENWSDEAFQQSSAEKYTERFLQRAESIFREFAELESKHPRLVPFLREHHPKAYACLTGQFATVLKAERHDLVPPPERPRPTVEQVQAMIARREQVVSQDELVAYMAVVEGYQRKVEALQQAGMDDEQIFELLGTLFDAISEAKQRLEARKGGGKGGPNGAAIATLA